MVPSMPHAHAGGVRTEGGTDMNDWKLGPLPIASLDRWGYSEPRRRPRAPRPRRSVIRRVVAAVRRLVADRPRTPSREVLAQRDGRYLHPG
jgi:hypothetical protein